MLAVIFVAVNFFVDMLYMSLDPQISYFEDKSICRRLSRHPFSKSSRPVFGL